MDIDRSKMAGKFAMTLVLTLGLPPHTYGQDRDRHRCTMGDLTRRVEIIHETGVSVPCEVHYYKDSEEAGERQVLWRAANEEGYCEARTADFVEQLTTMGWDCNVADVAAIESSDRTPADIDMSGETQSGVDPVPAENNVTDDTDALAPADDTPPRN